MADRVPFREGVFEENAGGGALLGNKCLSCGQVYFPKAVFCFRCFGKKMEDVALSRRGKLYSYTLCHLPASRFQPPFYVGMVDLPESVRVFAPLKAAGDKPLRVGMDMEVVIEELWRENDKRVIGYKFKPV
ncbi:MAG: Zn-ribbon domain-containing OB-fold protein [Peptococcaceae bacterium]|nr:Zn-ribbon domain-containing OB-fold protein [Peptococcaceae bacterium]